MKVIAMTTKQPRRSFTRRLTALFGNLYWDPIGLGEVVSLVTSRGPQPRPQAGLAQTRQAHPAGKVPSRV
jgi:hypothetical protein